MIEVFLSYSHKDLVHKESLETHLSLLRRKKIIGTWSDREIIPGQEWGSQITEKLEIAQVILFLVSSDFIASDYCTITGVRYKLNAIIK
ncbi:MAG: toll/interleukin-1 receptor domain-containing protein [Sedimenticola sp.]